MNAAAKKAIERAVGRASQAMLNVVKVFEEHGKDISDDDTLKVMRHLQNALLATGNRANAARAMTRALKIDAFSLDAEVPGVVDGMTSTIRESIQPPTGIIAPNYETGVLVLGAPPVAPPAQPAERPRWRKPIGREAGTKALIYEDDAPPPASTAAKELTASFDKSTGLIKDAGFLDT